jgi:predicted ATP-grasp superfamily ATP-dependent carboligase
MHRRGVASSLSVVVTDAETRAAVAACRGLAAAGLTPVAVAGTTPAPAHWSRSCRERHVCPHPLDDEIGFVAGLERILDGRPRCVLLPGSDASLRAVSEHRARLESRTALGLPAHAIVLRCLDKLALSGAAAQCGLPCPPTAVCSGLSEALAAASGFGYPVLLKPRQAVVEMNGVLRRPASVKVADADALARRLPRFGGTCLVQPDEPGAIVSYAGVVDDGQLLARAVSTYRRTWPPQAGSAAFSETFEPPARLDEQVHAMLRQLEWRGIFELELIARERGGYSAIDFNPRVYGSLALAIGAGANIPAIWSCRVLGARPRPAHATPGIRFRREDADLRNVLWHLRAGQVRRAARICRPRRRVVHAQFRARDPGPAVVDAVIEARAGLSRLRVKTRSRH